MDTKVLVPLEASVAKDLGVCLQANGMSEAHRAAARFVLTHASADLSYVQSDGSRVSDLALAIVPAWLHESWAEQVWLRSGSAYNSQTVVTFYCRLCFDSRRTPHARSCVR